MSRKRLQNRHPAHPANWPVWLGLAIAALLAQLPWRALLATGRGLGRVSWHLARERRHIAETNTRLCFPELDHREQQRLAREAVISAGMGLTEMLGVYFRVHLDLSRHVETEGLEHLEQARARGCGVLLLGMHFTTLEVAGFLLGAITPYGAVYRPNDNPLLDRIIRFGRGRHVTHYIDRTDLRGLVRSLKKGDMIWYAPDQDYGRKHSVYAPFFGVPAATITATARIARLSGSPVIPMSYYRLGKGRYRLVFAPALENFPSGDDLQDARRVNQIIEQAVRRAPEQYLWVHRRFKHQPDGSRPYAQT
jgi:KDO2-lipid IV(A) lauroyltransferase